MLARSAGAATREPLGHELGAVRHAQYGERIPGVIADDDLLSQSATRRPGPAGVGEQAFALDGGAGQGLPDFDRHYRHVGGTGQGFGPVVAAERAESARGEVDGGYRPPVAVTALDGEQVDHAAVRLHPFRRRFRQRSEHERRDVVADHVAGPGGRGRLRVQEASGRRHRADGCAHATVVRKFGQGHALDGVEDHRAGVAEGHVDAPAHARSRPREVGVQAPLAHLDAHRQRDRAIRAFDLDPVAVDAGTHAGQAFAHRALGTAPEFPGERAEVGNGVLVEEVEERALPHRGRGHVRHQISDYLVRRSHIGARDLHGEVIAATGLEELADRQAQPLVVDLLRSRAESEPADIRKMGDADHVGDNSPAPEHRAHHADIE